MPASALNPLQNALNPFEINKDTGTQTQSLLCTRLSDLNKDTVPSLCFYQNEVDAQ